MPRPRKPVDPKEATTSEIPQLPKGGGSGTHPIALFPRTHNQPPEGLPIEERLSCSIPDALLITG